MLPFRCVVLIFGGVTIFASTDHNACNKFSNEMSSKFQMSMMEIDFSQNVEDDNSLTFVIRTFLLFLTYPVNSSLLLSTGSEDTIYDPGYLDFEDSRAHGFVHSHSRASYPQLYLRNPIS
ncbi:hypothetical protein Tco_1549661 [Tanacetum coccineum]